MRAPHPSTHRRYAINALATVSLFAAAGCFEKAEEDEDDGDGGGGSAGGIVGVWGLDALSYSYYGKTYSMDYPYSYTDEGTTYTYGIRMDIRTVESGEFYTYYEYTYASGESYSYVEDGYEITVTETGTATYSIQVHSELVMDCTLAGNSLACDALVDGKVPLTLDWVRL